MSGETQEVVQLSLDQLVVGENIRCGLKPYKIEWLAKQIEEAGRIHTALKVEPYGNGTYMIREGHYRRAAAEWLEEHGVMFLTLPCIIEPVTQSRRERILKQLSENRDRENLSPLEISNTIHKLIEEGMPRAEIMQRFSRPGGKGKSLTMEPLSEASYSYYLRYRELPEEVQMGLHHGTVHVGAANRFLNESDPDKRAQLIADAEQKRQERLAREEPQDQELEKNKAEHAQYLADFAKNHKIVEARSKEIGELEKRYLEKKTASDAAFKSVGNLKGEKRKKAYQAYQATRAETEQAKSRLKTAQNERRKAQTDIRRTALTGKRVEASERSQKKRRALSERDVAAADQTGRMKLGAVDMRAAVKYWAQGPFPKVVAIALIIQKTFDSILTADQARRELAKVTDERKRR